MKKSGALVGILAVLASTGAAASCGAAFCLVNTDWAAQGAHLEPGLRLDLRHEWIDLDEPRAGRHRVAVGEMPRHHDEVETRNRNLVASLDWNFAPAWGLAFTVPYVDRDHVHIHNHRGAKIPESWSFRELGDARLLARHTVTDFVAPDASAARAWGFTFGAKLPTGKRDVRNAEGVEAERTLQPGSGTTDFVFGAFLHGALPLAGWSWFGRAQATLPGPERAGFRPGRQLQVDGGARYSVGPGVALMLQANALVRGRDSGAEAEPEDSGQRSVSLSPGFAWSASRDLQVYAFVQVPVYQSVNGVQLTASRSVVAGLAWRY